MTGLSAAGVGVAAAAVLAALAHAFSLPVNHDAAWLLHLSGAVLDGAELYVDLFEINPPLIVWLGIPLILLERASGISHLTLFQLTVALAALGSMLVSHRLARHVLSEEARPAFLVALAIALFLLPAILTGQREQPAPIWGQREHIMLLAVTPYIVACASRARGIVPRHGFLIGTVAGIGFALKPHFVPALLTLEAWVWLSRRRLWSGTAAALGLIAAYGVLVATTTEYLPMALQLRDTFTAYAPRPIREIVYDGRTLIAALALATMLLPGEGRALRRAFGIATSAWIFALVVQQKGFDYHYLPSLAHASVLLILGLVALVVGRAPARLALAATALATIGIAAQFPARAEHYRWPMIREARELMQGEQAVILSPYARDVWPHMSYARSSYPSISLWPLATGHGEGLAVQWLVPLLDDGVLALVPVNDRRSALPALLRNPAFRTAWAEYREVRSGRFYRVYQRAPPASLP